MFSVSHRRASARCYQQGCCAEDQGWFMLGRREPEVEELYSLTQCAHLWQQGRDYQGAGRIQVLSGVIH